MNLRSKYYNNHTGAREMAPPHKNKQISSLAHTNTYQQILSGVRYSVRLVTYFISARTRIYFAPISKVNFCFVSMHKLL